MNDDTIKDELFGILESDRFTLMAAQSKYKDIVREAVSEMATGGMPPHYYEVVATGILHYVLARSRTPSMRKASYGDVELDIVIPGTRELQARPKSALVIQICCDCDQIYDVMGKTQKVQPIRDNIWVLTQDCDIPWTYTISGESATFPDMVSDAIQFARDLRFDRLGIIP